MKNAEGKVLIIIIIMHNLSLALHASLTCSCPLGAAISDIPVEACPEDFGQIQKIFFQRRFSTGTTENTIAQASIDVLATWTGLETAADGTKLQVSPYIKNPVNEAGGNRQGPTGNAALNGIPRSLGTEPGTFSAVIESSKQNVIEALKTLRCEDLVVFFVNANNQIAGITDDLDSPTLIKGIPIQELFIGDKVLGGYDGFDYNDISFQLPPDWSDKFYVVTVTTFNPLTAIA